MVDNVLLEKRNRYLGKLIRKTHDLTESVKLLSSIDRELYSQSGGTLTDAINKLLNPILVQRSGDTDNFAGLTVAVGKLQDTVARFSQFEKDLSNMGRPVFYIKAPTNQDSMNKIIAQIQAHTGSLDNHVIIKITNFLSNPAYRTVAKVYEDLASAYNDSKEDKEKQYSNLIAAHTVLDDFVQAYIKSNPTDSELINVVFNVMYPKPLRQVAQVEAVQGTVKLDESVKNDTPARAVNPPVNQRPAPGRLSQDTSKPDESVQSGSSQKRTVNPSAQPRQAPRKTATGQ